MREVVIAGAVRTAIGKFGGALAQVPAARLGAAAVAEAIRRAGIPPEVVDEVILGHVLQAGQGQGTARQAARMAGLPDSVPAMSVNNICGSGLKAVNLAAAMVASGQADIVVAGGMESMSLAPYALNQARSGYRMGDGTLVDTMVNDALTDAFGSGHMGITAENLAARYGLSRQEQDEYAAESQNRAERAIAAGRFVEEIVAVEVPAGRGETRRFDADEPPRAGVTAASLAVLKPAFRKDGTVTAANASGLSDGAAAMIVMSREKAEALGVVPMASIVSTASAGVDPSVMGIGPAHSTRKALASAGLAIGDIGLVEANEAFAAQALAVGRELGWDRSRVNVDGGAIALGHPVGASGARILTTLLHRMRLDGVDLGLATLCVGGGMGVSTIVGRI